MSDAARHPEAQTMAAFVDGKLGRDEVATVAAHLRDCSDCRMVVEETARFEREEESRLQPSWRSHWLALAAVLAAIAIGVSFYVRREKHDGTPTAALIEVAPREHRFVPARLAGFPWARLQAPSRGDSAPQPVDLKLAGRAGEVLEKNLDRNDPAARHATGVAYLLIGRTAESISALEDASKGTSDWQVWNDLAAARLSHALRDQRTSDLPQALADIDEALRLSPNAAAAHFNRAMILESLGLRDAARSAWERSLQLDAASEWSNEAREHLQKLSKRSAHFDPKLLDTMPIDDVVRRFPQESRREGEGTLLAAWADAEAANDSTDAMTTLVRLRVVGNALAQVNGERLLADAVAAIDRADGAERATLVQAHRLYRDARIAYSRRRAGEAEKMFRGAETLFAEGRSPMAAVARYYAASAAYDQSRGDEAQRELDQLLLRVDATRHRALAAQIRWQLAVCANTAGDWGAATRNADAAAASFRTLGERVHAAYLDGIAAMAMELIGESDLAWDRRVRTFAVLGDAQDASRLATILHSSAMTLAALGRTAAATSLIELLAAGGGADATQLSYAYANGARYAARGGDVKRARSTLASARLYAAAIADPALREKVAAQIALAEGTLQNAAGAQPSGVVLQQSISFFTQGHANIDLPDAFLQRARSLRAAGNDAAAAADYAAAFEELEHQRATITDAESRLRFLNVAAPIFEDTIDLRLAMGDVAGAFAAADRSRHLLDAASSDVRTETPPIAAGTAIIEYVVMPRSVIVFCLTPDALTSERIAIDRRELETLVASFAERIRRRVPPPELRASAAALHRLLIEPIEGKLPGVQELVLVPDRQLHAVPFAALWSEKDSEYLVERYTLRFAPSAAFRRTLNPRRGPSLVVADPTTPQWPPLPASREEASRLAAMDDATSGTTLLTGDSATRAAFVDTARRSALIHFAGHANSDAASSYGALLFAPRGSDSGALGSGDAARLRLDLNPLVVLAACGTFRGDALHVAGMSSLSRSFLTAGARGVVGTLWEIDDDVSAPLFLRFHEHLRDGMTPARALRAAQNDSRRSADPRQQHPATWAPVALLTDV